MAEVEIDSATGLAKAIPVVRNDNHKRMTNILDQILVAWMMHPELRLGQLLTNATQPDIFYVPDKELARKTLEFAEVYGKKS